MSSTMFAIEGKVAWMSPKLDLAALEDLWLLAGGRIAHPSLVKDGQIIDYFFADPVEPCQFSKRWSLSISSHPEPC